MLVPVVNLASVMRLIRGSYSELFCVSQDPCNVASSPDSRSYVQPPDFYDSTPPAPPGIVWWQYKAGVPPLPAPTEIDPTWTRYGWRYDPNWRPLSYTPNNMDQASTVALFWSRGCLVSYYKSQHCAKIPQSKKLFCPLSCTDAGSSLLSL